MDIVASIKCSLKSLIGDYKGEQGKEIENRTLKRIENN